MKNVKKYFKMIITAVICFAMSLIPGKKANAKVIEVLADGQAVSRNTERNSVNTRTENVSVFSRSNENVTRQSNCRRLYLKKVFYWLQGPGDRIPLAYEGSG
ncbi:hypothetical protein NXH76_05370 [Blautia schinkii]|nr:hypothetical protein [Blautia schinkii]